MRSLTGALANCAVLGLAGALPAQHKVGSLQTGGPGTGYKLINDPCTKDNECQYPAMCCEYHPGGLYRPPNFYGAVTSGNLTCQHTNSGSYNFPEEYIAAPAPPPQPPADEGGSGEELLDPEYQNSHHGK